MSSFTDNLSVESQKRFCSQYHLVYNLNLSPCNIKLKLKTTKEQHTGTRGRNRGTLSQRSRYSTPVVLD